MEVDCIGKPLFVAEASAANLDHLDPAIEAFRWSIAYLQDHRIQNAPQVFFDRPGHFLDRLQAITGRPCA